MNNRARLTIAVGVGIAMVILIASIAGLYSIPFAIVAVGAGLMLIGNHFGVYALPANTATLLSRAIRYALIAVVIVWGWNTFTSGKKMSASKKPAKATTSVVRTDDTGKYVNHHNWSKDPRAFFSKEVVIPERSEGWVSIAVPPYGRIETSRTFDIEYDLGGKETVKEGPNLPRVEAPIPATFGVRALGKGGTLRIVFHLDPKPEPKKASVEKKQKSFVKSSGEGRPTSPQIEHSISGRMPTSPQVEEVS